MGYKKEDDDEIDLMKVYDTLKKWWWVVATIIVISTATSGFISYYHLENIYQSSTTLYTGTLSQGSLTSLLQELQVGENVIKDYSVIIKSRLVVEETKKLLKEDSKSNPKLSEVSSLPYMSFSGKINVGLINDTHIMKINVTDKDPEVCMIIANKIAGVFIDKVQTITKVNNVRVIDEAIMSDIPVKPSRKKNVAVSFGLGFIGGMGIILLIFFLDNTVKTKEDVIKNLELPVIGVVREFDIKAVGK